MAAIEIISEEPGDRRWSFLAQVLDDDGAIRRHHVLLSWADYNLWSRDGADPPASVAEAVLRFLLNRLSSADDVPESFDASRARRLFADADDVIPTLIQA